jgi:hypothetical protein
MRYRDYLAFEGSCSVALGLALALVSFPGLFIDWDGAGWGLLFVPAVLLALGGFAALRRGVGLLDVGGWLTARPLAGAVAGRPALGAGGLRRRLVVETAIWIVAVTAWVLVGATDGLLIFGTGLASAAYGLVQAVASRARVARVERERGEEYLVAERPGLGLPRLTRVERA